MRPHLLSLFFCLVDFPTALSLKFVREKDFDDVRLDKAGYEKVQSLHYNWYLHGIKAIMGQLGKDLWKKLDKENKNKFYHCLDKIPDRRDVVSAARCLVAAREGYVNMVDQKVHRRKRSPCRLIVDSVSKSDSHGFNVKNMPKAPYLKTVKRSAVQKITGLVRTMVGLNETQGSWSASYNSILSIKKAMDRRAKDPGARVYDMRMLDLVLDRNYATAGANDKPIMPPLAQEAYDLLTSLNKSPKSTRQENVKFLSPRFAPVMPDKADVRGKLSPSILSFYNDDSEDQIIPLPKLLEATGMSSNDRETILETVMELSGAKETVSKAVKVLEKMNLFGMEGELKEVTERIAKHFKELEKSFSYQQKREIKRKGFTFLESDQLEDLYTKQGIRQRDDLPINVDEYKTLSRKDKEKSLWLRIEQIASNLTVEEHSRTKRQALVYVLQPLTLAPFMFSPIYGLSVLGPAVLSPSIFSPLILNPAVLSPYALSPAVGMPFILSAFVLSPFVLSPMVMAPFILTPYVLTPNIINPYVLSPLILSPLVLCPDVLSPMVLGGGILSPGVASPSILSKSVLMASVLSPSVLS